VLLMTYTNFTRDDLRGATPADFLIAIDADLAILDESRRVIREVDFPVVELASSLRVWSSLGSGEEFSFDSMSFEEPGVVVEASRVFGE
jgi:hypothetical protein